MSISTLGAVDLRSDKERIARSTRKSSKQLKEQTRIMKDQAQRERQQSSRTTKAKQASLTQAARQAVIASDAAKALRAQQALSALPVTPSTSLPPAGWYDDDDSPGKLKWWDGALWTEHRKDKATE